MPTYGYRCTNCENTFERVQKITEDALTECEECGGKLKKLIYPVGIQFVGSGFYVNDYKPGGKSGASSSNGGDSAPAGASSDSSSTSTETKPAETKSSDSSPAPASTAAPAASSSSSN